MCLTTDRWWTSRYLHHYLRQRCLEPGLSGRVSTIIGNHLDVYYKPISNFCLVNNVFLILRVILNGENNQRMGDTFIVAKYRDVIFTRLLHARKLLMPFPDLELQIRLKLRSARAHIKRRGEYPSRILLLGTSYLRLCLIFFSTFKFRVFFNKRIP